MNVRGQRARPRRAGAALDDVALRLHGVAVHLLRRAWAHDGEMGLSRSRASALSVLVFRGPLMLTELAAAEHVTAATMSRLVAALEQDGYVERLPHPSDARAVRLRATAAGRRVMQAGRRRRIEVLTELLQDLDEREVARIAEAVDLLEGALAR